MAKDRTKVGIAALAAAAAIGTAQAQTPADAAGIKSDLCKYNFNTATAMHQATPSLHPKPNPADYKDDKACMDASLAAMRAPEANKPTVVPDEKRANQNYPAAMGMIAVGAMLIIGIGTLFGKRRLGVRLAEKLSNRNIDHKNSIERFGEIIKLGNPNDAYVKEYIEKLREQGPQALRDTRYEAYINARIGRDLNDPEVVQYMQDRRALLASEQPPGSTRTAYDPFIAKWEKDRQDAADRMARSSREAAEEAARHRAPSAAPEPAAPMAAVTPADAAADRRAERLRAAAAAADAGAVDLSALRRGPAAGSPPPPSGTPPRPQ